MAPFTPTLNPESILALYPARYRPIGALVGLGGGGGLSGSLLWRFESGQGPSLLRAWPNPGPDRARLEQIHAWLGQVADLGFVPYPFPGSDGRAIQEGGGRFWELVPWLEGSVDRTEPPNPSRVCDAFRALASVHRRWESESALGPSPGLVDRLQELEVLHSKGFTSIESRLRATDDALLREVAREWLDLAPAAVVPVRAMLREAITYQVPRQPCLRDVRPDHFLFLGDKLNGLIDFGAMGHESVAGDVSRLSVEWLERHAELRGLALDAYES
ncbi:MAG: phosphotransferase enzyme family protein, partial [Isosphaeraceae bacterium]